MNYYVVQSDKHSWDIRRKDPPGLVARGSEQEMRDLLAKLEEKELNGTLFDEPAELPVLPSLARRRRAWWQIYGRGWL